MFIVYIIQLIIGVPRFDLVHQQTPSVQLSFLAVRPVRGFPNQPCANRRGFFFCGKSMVNPAEYQQKYHQNISVHFFVLLWIFFSIQRKTDWSLYVSEFWMLRLLSTPDMVDMFCWKLQGLMLCTKRMMTGRSISRSSARSMVELPRETTEVYRATRAPPNHPRNWPF